MIRLQKPAYVFFGGRIRPYEEAVLHIASEAVVRGLNVFEGLKGYWQPDGKFGIVALKRHWTRLGRSARLLHIPFETGLADFEESCHAIVAALCETERNMWVRATLYVVEGHWGEGTVADLVLTAYHQPKGQPEPVSTGISSWQRAADLALPSRIKTSSNYQVARLAKIEGRARGYSEMILLNQWGRVAEAVGSCVLVARDGKVATPPPWEGALESITIDIVSQLCVELGIPFERRPIERTELAIADEIALAGTINEVTLVRSLDGQEMPPAPLLGAIAKRYLDAVTGIAPHPAVELSPRARNSPAAALSNAAD
jgi:branched-chain amino acid aminotransferase